MRAHMAFHLSTHSLILTLVNTSTSESQNHSENFAFLDSCLQRVIPPPRSCLSCLNDVPANEQICISVTWKAKSHLRPTGKSLMTRPSDLPS